MEPLNSCGKPSAPLASAVRHVLGTFCWFCTRLTHSLSTDTWWREMGWLERGIRMGQGSSSPRGLVPSSVGPGAFFPRRLMHQQAPVYKHAFKSAPGTTVHSALHRKILHFTICWAKFIQALSFKKLIHTVLLHKYNTIYLIRLLRVSS